MQTVFAGEVLQSVQVAELISLFTPSSSSPLQPPPRPTPMRVCYITLLAATTILASFGNVSAEMDLDQSKVTSINAVRPIEAAQINSNRFLRRRKNYEGEDAAEEERSGLESIAAKFDKSLLPAIRRVSKMDSVRAALTLQQLGISFNNRMLIQAFLKLSKEDRKAVMLLIK